MKLRVYDNKGRERWLAPGQVAPAGWMDEKGNPFEKAQIVITVKEEGNPYEQFQRVRWLISLKEFRE